MTSATLPLKPSSQIISSVCLSARRQCTCRKDTSCGSVAESRPVPRRALFNVSLGALVAAQLLTRSAPAEAGLPAEVGTYLPLSSDPQFAVFVPDARKTPALRAGTVDPSKPYRFEVPVSFREGKVANILSGNYCQPRCDEPWTEVIFEDADRGRIALLVSPLKKLTNKSAANIDEIGPPEGILQSVGSYITGTFLDEESVVSMNQKKQDDGRTYYYYEVDSPYGLLGRHSFSACTTKGEVALLLVASASEKQWIKSKSQLKQVADSFRA